MLQSFFEHSNWWAILVSAVAFFVLGSVWFSVLFGKTWQAEVEKQGVKIKEPSRGEIGGKMLQTFLCNIAAAITMGILVYFMGISGALNGAKLGLLCGTGFAATSIVTASVWESRSFKLVAIDLGYPLFGIILCGIILASWQ